MRIILSNLDTIILNVKYNLVSAVSKKRKRFSRGRRWSSHESGQNWEAKDRPRTATYTRPLLIICHRLSTGRAKIFLAAILFFHSLRVLLASFFFLSFRSYFFFTTATKNQVIDDNTRHLFQYSLRGTSYQTREITLLLFLLLPHLLCAFLRYFTFLFCETFYARLFLPLYSVDQK